MWVMDGQVTHGQKGGERVNESVPPCEPHTVSLGVRRAAPLQPLLSVTSSYLVSLHQVSLPGGEDTAPVWPGREATDHLWQHLAHRSRLRGSRSGRPSPQQGWRRRHPPPELQGLQRGARHRASVPAAAPRGSVCSRGPGCYFCAVCVFRERIFQQLWRPGKSQPCPIMARGRGRWITDPTNALKFQKTRPEGQQGSLAFTSRCPPARQQGFTVTPRVLGRADTGPSDLTPCRLSLGPCPVAVASLHSNPEH